MAKKKSSKITIVREHPRRVPPSAQNPSGVTIVDQHLRRAPGTYLDREVIESVFKNYRRTGILYPAKGKLLNSTKSDAYDEQIAVWCAYFNKKFSGIPEIDPDMIKALIESESDFRIDPKENKTAFGIAQITKETLRVLQDTSGEVKEFVLKDIRLKDLKDPDIAIPMAIRWIARKRDLAAGKLKRAPTDEEIILEYKGLLKSKTEWKDRALEKYKKSYGKLKGK